MSLAFRRLVPSDETAVRGWLEAYLVEHVGWWLQARGLDEDPVALVRERGLVDRDWDELLVARAADFVVVAELDGAPAGIVRAALREDRHLGVTGGVLQWLAVGAGLPRPGRCRRADRAGHRLVRRPWRQRPGVRHRGQRRGGRRLRVCGLRRGRHADAAPADRVM